MDSTDITSLDSIASVDGSTDVFPIVDVSLDTTKKATRNQLLGLASAPLGTTDTQSPTNKTFDNTNIITVRDDRLTIQDNSDTTKQLQFQLSGITTATTRTLTVPDANTTIVGTTATQTLTNKTLTSPTINNATISNPTLSVDTIAEYTSANGVSVDGMLIKDGTVGPGTITPAGLVTGTGSSWVWQTYTPTLTNITTGNGTLAAAYIQIGKTVFVRFTFTFGTTSSISADPYFTLPVTASSSYTAVSKDQGHPIGIMEYLDVGTASYNGKARLRSTTTVTPVVGVASGTYVTDTALSNTVPFTFGNLDQIMGSITYQAA